MRGKLISSFKIALFYKKNVFLYQFFFHIVIEMQCTLGNLRPFGRIPSLGLLADESPWTTTKKIQMAYKYDFSFCIQRRKHFARCMTADTVISLKLQAGNFKFDNESRGIRCAKANNGVTRDADPSQSVWLLLLRLRLCQKIRLPRANQIEKLKKKKE